MTTQDRSANWKILLACALALGLTACTSQGSFEYRSALTGEECEPDPDTMVPMDDESDEGDQDNPRTWGDDHDDDEDWCFEPPEPGDEDPGDESDPIGLTGGGDCAWGDDCDDTCTTGDDCDDTCTTGDDCDDDDKCTWGEDCDDGGDDDDCEIPPGCDEDGCCVVDEGDDGPDGGSGSIIN